ncbi:MAG: hypothetical protein GX451_02085 [Acholeplasmataceae bacterium]|nr:hypothetical protein [Acholeplasmataceae bacterium]
MSKHVYTNGWTLDINNCPQCKSNKITASACETAEKQAYAYILCDGCGKELAKYCDLSNVTKTLEEIAEEWNKKAD